MDLRGDLSVFSPVSVLQFLNLAVVTGKLEFISARNRAAVYFDKGTIIFAEIASRPVRLGEYLVKKGKITKKDVDRVLPKQRPGQRIGALLVEQEVIDQATLEEAVREQIKAIVYEVVRWDGGTFWFQANERPDAREILIDVPIDHLMLEGLKRLDEEDDPA